MLDIKIACKKNKFLHKIELKCFPIAKEIEDYIEQSWYTLNVNGIHFNCQNNAGLMLYSKKLHLPFQHEGYTNITSSQLTTNWDCVIRTHEEFKEAIKLLAQEFIKYRGQGLIAFKSTKYSFHLRIIE